MGMAGFGAGDDLPVQIVQCGKQVGPSAVESPLSGPARSSLSAERAFGPVRKHLLSPARLEVGFEPPDHFETHVTLTPNSSATFHPAFRPEPACRIIFARRLSRRGVVDARTRLRSSTRSSRVKANRLTGLPMDPGYSRRPIIATHLSDRTLAHRNASRETDADVNRL